MHQALDAFLQLDESAVVGEADGPSRDAGPGRVLLADADPRVGHTLLVAQRNALALGIEVQDDDIDLIADVEKLGRMGDAPPRHVGDVQQTVDAAEVDEGAVVGDVLDHTLEDVAGGELCEGVLLLLGALGLEDDLAGDDDVGASLVELDDLDADLLVDHRLEVAHRADVHLRAGEERADADIDRQAAFDPIDHEAGDDLVAAVGIFNLAPDLHLLGLLARYDDVSFLVLAALE